MSDDTWKRVYIFKSRQWRSDKHCSSNIGAACIKYLQTSSCLSKIRSPIDDTIKHVGFLLMDGPNSHGRDDPYPMEWISRNLVPEVHSSPRLSGARGSK